MRLRTLATVALLALALAGCGGDDGTASDSPPSSSGGGATTPAHSSDQAEPSPTDSSASTSGPATVAVPLYFVGTTPQGPRLYREFQQLPAADPLGEALAKISSGDADDPDYRTLLPGTGLTGKDGGEGLTVTVPSGMTARPSDTSDREASLAVQQVVYTVDAVLQQPEPVTFVDASGAPTSFLGMATPTGGFTVAKPLSVLALVNITQPQQNSEPGSHFTASGVASSFEANVPWEVQDSSGKTVASGSATADGWLKKLWPWQADIDLSSLPAGTYTFVAKTDDPSDGEGPGPTVDTKTFVLH
jgi:hypothetical protein